MPRRTIRINFALLRTVISEEEQRFAGNGLTEFYKRCATIYNEQKSPLEEKISFSLVYKYIKEGKISTNIMSAGRGGYLKGRTLSEEHKAALHSGRKNKKKTPIQYGDKLRKEWSGANPDVLNRLNKAIQRGSLRDRIWIKCMDCCCLQKTEIKQCTSTTCGLYDIRPYRVKVNNDDNQIGETESICNGSPL